MLYDCSATSFCDCSATTGSGVGASVTSTVGSGVGAFVTSTVGSGVGASVTSTVGSGVGASVTSTVGSGVLVSFTLTVGVVSLAGVIDAVTTDSELASMGYLSDVSLPFVFNIPINIRTEITVANAFKIGFQLFLFLNIR